MKADDEVRRELDKIVPFQPKAKRSKPDKPARELSTVWADDITINLDAGGLVDGLLSSTGMTVLYGESGCGKTFVAVDLACHVAAGRPWRGMEVEQGVVVYVAAESPESVKKRLWAWKKHHGVGHLRSGGHLERGPAQRRLRRTGGPDRQVRETRGRVALVIVDTLARAMTGNENAPDDMGKFVAACGRLREAGETHVMVVHHCGKDAARGARGHSSPQGRDRRRARGHEQRGQRRRPGDEAPRRGRRRLLRLQAGAGRAGHQRQGSGGHHLRGYRERGAYRRQGQREPTAAPERQGQAAPAGGREGAEVRGRAPTPHDEVQGVTAAVTVTVSRSYWRQLIGWEEADEREKERSRQDWKRGLENAIAAGAVRRWGDWLWLP
jgi:hypothetical protein